MRKEILLPGITLAGSAAGFFLRRWELATAFEPGTNLPIAGMPATWALIALSLVMAGAILLLSLGRHFAFPGGYDQAFRSASPHYAAVTITAGFLLGAGGVLKLIQFPADLQAYQALSGQVLFSFLPRLLLVALCLAAALCIILTARNNYRGEGGGARSALLLVPPYAGCLWLITAYQTRAADPVLVDYIYQILAIVAILLALYDMAGFSFEKPRVAGTVCACLTGVYLSAVTLADSNDLATLVLFAFAILYLTASAAVLLRNDRLLLADASAEPNPEGGNR